MEKNNQPVLGYDIGNANGYVSLLIDEKNDPVCMLPDRYLSGMFVKTGVPTTAHIGAWSDTGENGEKIYDKDIIDVFSEGKTAEKKLCCQNAV